MELNCYLKHVCSIENHPISRLNERMRIKYVRGLGACISCLSLNSEISKMYYIAWAKSILNNKTNAMQYWCSNKEWVKDAITIHFYKWRFTTMKYSFIFDVYYLMLASTPQKDKKSTLERIFNYFEIDIRSGCRKALKCVHSYFDLTNENDIISKIDKELLHHQKMNDMVCSSSINKVLVVANVSAGKSTLVNALVGYRLNKVKTTICTNKIEMLYCKHAKDGITTYEEDLHQYKYNEEVESIDSTRFNQASFQYNSKYIKKNFCLIDTPGYNNSVNLEHKKITEDIIREGDYDKIIYVSDSQYCGSQDEYNMLVKLQRMVKTPIIFVLNKIDQFKQTEDSVSKMLGDFKQDLIKIGFKNPIVIPISAYAALLFKLDEKKLGEDDLFDKELYVKKFSKKYYDLPTYIGEKESSDLLEKTGIINLEKLLIAK